MPVNYLRPVNSQSKGMFSVFLHLNSPQGAPSQEALGVGMGRLQGLMAATFYVYWNGRPTFFVHTSLVLKAYLFGSTFWMDHIKAFRSICTGNLWWQVLCLALGMQRPVCGRVCHRLLGDTQSTIIRAIIHQHIY